MNSHIDIAYLIEFGKSLNRFEFKLKTLLKNIDEGRIDLQFAHQRLDKIKIMMNVQKEKLCQF